jgi:hypothetical protein
MRFRLALPALATCLLVLAGCAAGEEGGGGGGGAPGADQPEVKQQTLCGAVTAWSKKCAGSVGATSAPSAASCNDELAASCGSLASVLNPTLLDAARKCAEAATCDGAPASCLASAAAEAQPREAHQKLAKAYCSRCTAAGSACEEAFVSREGASKALAALALPLSDALADEVATKCTSTPGCGATFLACAQAVVTKAVGEQLDADGAACLMKGMFDDVASSGGGTSGGGGTNPSCKPATCADLGKSCGLQDDGCGKKIDCGACPTNCQPKTCAQLGKTCGSWDDGCGGTVSCGACPTQCAADAKEPNNDKAHAADLGTLTDSPASTKSAYNLTLPDGDEDWFTAKVTDAGWWGNPRIQVTTARAVEVSIYYVCNNGGDASYCPNGETPDNAFGTGCRSISTATLQTSCSGIDESGTVYVRVRKTKSDGQCGGYSIDVSVNEG